MPKSSSIERNNKTWDTYEGWRAHGYQVQKGEKAERINGVAMFSEDQVYDPSEDGDSMTDVCNKFGPY